MGALLAKFRKEKTTAELLEKLEDDIQELEKYTINTQERKRRFVGTFLTFSIGIFVVIGLLVYFVYLPPTWKERAMYSVPMLLFPFVIILLRKLFTWYFQRKLNKNSDKLYALRVEKKDILEQVMDKETYKVAVNLLARYGGDKTGTSKFAVGKPAMSPRMPNTPAAGPVNQSLLRLNNQVRLASSSSSGTQMTPSLAAMTRPTPRHAPMAQLGGPARQPGQLAMTPQARPDQQLVRRRTPFPIVNQQEKGVLERIVDVLIGDGPQDRFAMICKECFGHNGMALKEEFDYTTFRCAFCNVLNPARKERPVAPRLPQQHLRLTANDSSDSDSSGSDPDSDAEHRAAPTINLKEATPPPPAHELDEIDDIEMIDSALVDDEAIATGLSNKTLPDAQAAGDHLSTQLSDDLKKEM